MANALYLITSLPYFDLEHHSAYYKDIDELCEECLVLDEPHATTVLDAIKNPTNSVLNIARTWALYEYSIRNEIGKKRWSTLRSGQYTPVFIFDEIPVSAEALDVLQFINQEHNPLLREREIIKVKWNILEALDAHYQFSIENIVIYGWKLQLYFMYRSLTEQRGQHRWDSLVSVLASRLGVALSATYGGGSNG